MQLRYADNIKMLTVFFLAAPASGAYASSGGSLPWEGPLQKIQQSITGPVAGYIALSAVAIAGGMLIFGGELNDFARRLMYIVLVAGILLGATTIVGLFGATGAIVGEVPAGRFGVADISDLLRRISPVNTQENGGGHA